MQLVQMQSEPPDESIISYYCMLKSKGEPPLLEQTIFKLYTFTVCYGYEYENGVNVLSIKMEP